MQTKHTRAPWRVRNDFGNLKIIQPEMDIELARMVVCDDDFDEAESNARLIAAAPELLEALIGMMVEFGGDFENDAILAAHAAIAKATGETNEQN